MSLSFTAATDFTLAAPAPDALSVSVPPASGPKVDKPRVRVQARSSRYFGSSRFDGAGTDNRLLEGWSAYLNSPEPVGGQHERDTVTARLRDLENNDPLARSAIERRVDNIIGHGWGLTSMPNAKALGIDFDAAVDLAELIECEWESYTQHPLGCLTIEEDYSLSQILGMAYRYTYRDGEIFALLPAVAPHRGHHYSTRIQLIDPDRVSNPHNASDTETLKRGMELDSNGRVVAIHIREGHPADWTVPMKSQIWRRVAMRGPTGRPNVIHHKTRTRIGQLRGVSRLTPIIKALRGMNVFDDAELQTKVANSVVTGFITSNFDVATAGQSVSAEVVDKLDQERMEFYEKNPGVRKNPLGGKYSVLPGGDTYTGVETRRDTGEDYVNRVLHHIAAAAGLTYEQMTMRFDKLNYSSFRGALLEIYKDFRRDQEDFAKGFVGIWFFAWLEEAFALRRIEPPQTKSGESAPSFYDAPAAYSRFKPILPPKGWVDAVKEATASGIRMNLDLSSLADEASEQGKDWKDTLHQKARERKTRQSLGLPVQPYKVAMSTNSREDKSESRDLEENEHLNEDESENDDA